MKESSRISAPIDTARGPTGQTARYRVGDLIVDLGRERVTRDGCDIPLNKLTFDLLAELVRAAPDIVSIDALMEGVWPGRVVSLETVTQRVKRLRSALQDESKSPRYIAGVRGRGYRLVAPVTTCAEPEPLPAPARKRLRAGVARVVVGSILLIAAAGAAWFFMRSTNGIARSPVPVRAASIAVLPFANLTGDPSLDYFGDGLAEELIDSLARVPGLKVPARTSSFAYKGHDTDARRIGRDLAVATVLEGSVRRAGDHVRVSAQLVDTATGYHLWSRSYDRQLTDVFALEDELAAAIQLAMRGNVAVPVPASAMHLPPTQDVEAYLLYLRARALTVPTEDGFRATMALYDQALARDSGFARALAGRAFTQVRIALFGYPVPHALEDAERDARQALAIDPKLGAAHAVLGETSALRTQWLEADAHFRAALAADPADPLVHGSYAVEVLAPAGKLADAQREARAGFQLAPADANAIVNRAVVSWYLGDDKEATEVLDLGRMLMGSSTPEYPPGPEIRAAVATRAGRYDEAAELIVRGLGSKVRETDGVRVTRAVYSALADPAKRLTATRALHALVASLKGKDVDALAYRDFIVEFAMLGATDEAYDLAEWYLQKFSSGGNGSGPAWGFLWLPEMSGFRIDPRFQDLATRLHLMEYWEHVGPPDDCNLDGKGNLSCGVGARQ